MPSGMAQMSFRREFSPQAKAGGGAIFPAEKSERGFRHRAGSIPPRGAMPFIYARLRVRLSLSAFGSYLGVTMFLTAVAVQDPCFPLAVSVPSSFSFRAIALRDIPASSRALISGHILAANR